MATNKNFRMAELIPNFLFWNYFGIIFEWTFFSLAAMRPQLLFQKRMMDTIDFLFTSIISI